MPLSVRTKPKRRFSTVTLVVNVLFDDAEISSSSMLEASALLFWELGHGTLLPA